MACRNETCHVRMNEKNNRDHPFNKQIPGIYKKTYEVYQYCSLLVAVCSRIHYLVARVCVVPVQQQVGYDLVKDIVCAGGRFPWSELEKACT